MGSYPDQLDLFELVAIGMHPYAVHQRPSFWERSGRRQGSGGLLLAFLTRALLRARRLGTQGNATEEAGENKQRNNFFNHISFKLPFCAREEVLGGATRSEGEQTIRSP